MADSFITPIRVIETITASSDIGTANNTDGSVFQSIFGEMIRNVVETDAAVSADVQALATGETDSLHQLQIDQAKAQLAIELLTQTRNKALDAYNQIIGMGL
jgi:flagellar hook-basal body complex protein FliE